MADEKKTQPTKRIVEIDLRDLFPAEDAKGGAASTGPKEPEKAPTSGNEK